MADVYFQCICGKSLAVDERGVGLMVKCVDCGQPVKVPDFDIEFACEGCKAVLLAPISVGGDRIKCALCGHRMTVPRLGIDIRPARADLLGHARSGFQVRRRSMPVPAPAGIAWRQLVHLMFRVALLVSALAVGAELSQRFILKRPPTPEIAGLIEESKSGTRLGNLSAISSGETLATAPMDETPTAVTELEAVEPARSSKVIQVAMSSVTPARDRQTTPAKPARTPADASEVKNVIHPPQPLLDEYKEPEEARQPESGRQEKHNLDSRNQAMTKNAPAYTRTQPVGGWVELKKRVPALQEVVDESQKLNSLINYKNGWKQSKEFFDLLQKSMGQINKYTQTHTGKDLDDFYWSTAYWIIYGHAIKTARSYEEAENILRQGWALLEGAESDKPRSVPRTILSMGVNLAQDWVKENPLECAMMLDELEGMAQEMGDDKIGDIWRLNAPALQVRFMKYAGNVPEEKRAVFVQRHKQRLERYLLDDSIRMRNRAATLRGWIVFLDKYGALTDALPVIREWQERYGNQTTEMNYYFARFWVELYGEGDWDKAAKTVRLATTAAQGGGKLFDVKNYVKLTKLYYDLLWWPGYELKRQRAIKRNEAGKEELKTVLYTAKIK